MYITTLHLFFSKIPFSASTFYPFPKKKSQRNIPDNLGTNTSIHLSATLTNTTERKEQYEMEAAK